MILVLDTHPLSRQGLESVIRMHRPGEQVLQAGTVREAVSFVERSPVEMAFVDLQLKQESGFSFVRWLREQGKPVKVLLIAADLKNRDFEQARRLGVDACVQKDALLEEILYGLKVVERGGKFYSSGLIESMEEEEQERKKMENLTGREMDVLKLLSLGYSNAVIGRQLYISEGTVKKHITSILGKLCLKNRVEAVLYASRNLPDDFREDPQTGQKNEREKRYVPNRNYEISGQEKCL